MDTRELRNAYDGFLEAAAQPDLGHAAGGGWDADHVLAHVLSVDAAIAAAALTIVSGGRPGFDNRISLDAWNLERIIGECSGRAELISRLRRQAAVLCDIADGLSDAAASVLVPTLLMSDDVLLVDQPVTLADLIDGLAFDHVPKHAEQLRALSESTAGTS